MPTAHTLPRLAMPGLLENASEPNPATAVPPHSISARPTERRTAPRSPPCRRKASWMKMRVIHARAQHQRQRHQVHQVPGPAGHRHDRQQAQSAQAQHRHAQQNFRRPAKREPEREQHQQHHRRHHLPHSRLHALQGRVARAIPSRKAARRSWPAVWTSPASAAGVDLVGCGINQAHHQPFVRRSRDEPFQQPLAHVIGRPEARPCWRRRAPRSAPIPPSAPGRWC